MARVSQNVGHPCFIVFQDSHPQIPSTPTQSLKSLLIFTIQGSTSDYRGGSFLVQLLLKSVSLYTYLHICKKKGNTYPALLGKSNIKFIDAKKNFCHIRIFFYVLLKQSGTIHTNFIRFLCAFQSVGGGELVINVN